MPFCGIVGEAGQAEDWALTHHWRLVLPTAPMPSEPQPARLSRQYTESQPEYHAYYDDDLATVPSIGTPAQ